MWYGQAAGAAPLLDLFGRYIVILSPLSVSMNNECVLKKGKK